MRKILEDTTFYYTLYAARLTSVTKSFLERYVEQLDFFILNLIEGSKPFKLIVTGLFAGCDLRDTR